jgi:hypothetical protein
LRIANEWSSRLASFGEKVPLVKGARWIESPGCFRINLSSRSPDDQTLIGGGPTMLTESEVTRSWSKLFKGERNDATFDKAEALLDELRPESPLRHRLAAELDELRQACSSS